MFGRKRPSHSLFPIETNNLFSPSQSLATYFCSEETREMSRLRGQHADVFALAEPERVVDHANGVIYRSEADEPVCLREIELIVRRSAFGC